MILQPEEREAQVFFRLFTVLLPGLRHALFHVANERQVAKGRSGYVTHALLAKAGFRSGVSDYFLAVPSDDAFHGLFLELKAGSGELHKPQRDFLDDMRRQGYGCAVAWNAEAAVAACMQYLDAVPSGKFQVVRGFPIAGRDVRTLGDWLKVPSYDLDGLTQRGLVRRKAKPCH